MTVTTDLDHRLQGLADRKQRWARLPIQAKIGYLKAIRELVVQHGDAWARAGARFKGFDYSSPLVGGEEWLGGPYPTAAWLTDAISTLQALADGKDPLRGIPVTTRDDGQLVLRVMPASVYDKLLLSGYSLDVWMEPGVTRETLQAGAFYAQKAPRGRVTVVLGAGNVSAIPALDTLYSMFVHGDVVALKLNPVADVYGPVFEAVFEPLIADGYLQVVYGDGQVGADLVNSELTDTVHITGSGATFDAIVWGTGPQATKRKAAGTPLLTKPITSELGGVGPTIVVPGQWSDADIAFQAEHIATQKLHTSGHTCVASQVLVLPADWPQREQFLEAVRQAFTDAPARKPFYPGASVRQDDFVSANPEAELIEGGQRVVMLEVDADSEHPGFAAEFFGPIYLVTSLPGDTEEYLRAAVEFANDRLAGNLGANVIVDPETASKHAVALDEAIADLRFGCIGVNAWAAVAFLTSRAAWGAYAGNSPENIESGSGAVHNSLMLERPQKNVVQAPFRSFPRSAQHRHLTMAVKPPWFLSNRTATSTARQFTHFAADPNPRRLPGLFAAALRG
jgi:aldehyde dehydrogenase (NAD(P)+)